MEELASGFGIVGFDVGVDLGLIAAVERIEPRGEGLAGGRVGDGRLR